MNKPETEHLSNANFYFGFQVLNATGQAFDWEDKKVIDPSILTESKSWDYENEIWKQTKLEKFYSLKHCDEIIREEQIETYQDLSQDDLKRSGIGDFYCPSGLLDKFI